MSKEFLKMQKLAGLITEGQYQKLVENDFESFLNSLNISSSPEQSEDEIDIGTSVAVMGHGIRFGTVVGIDDKNKIYTVSFEGSKENIKAPFDKVNPVASPIKVDSDLLEKIEDLKQEHRYYLKNFISNLSDFRSSNYEQDFADERWKLNSVAEFYLDLGKQMWDMFKQNKEYIEHSDEFSDLFIEISQLLSQLHMYDKGANEDFENVYLAYKKIGDRIGVMVG
jgi:hypothetical protein